MIVDGVNTCGCGVPGQMFVLLLVWVVIFYHARGLWMKFVIMQHETLSEFWKDQHCVYYFKTCLIVLSLCHFLDISVSRFQCLNIGC